MNKFKFISVVFIAAVMLSACEKEVNSPNANEFTKSSKKYINKGFEDEDVDVDLSQFLYDIINEDVPNVENVETALLYTESTLYWRLSNPDLIPGETKVYELEYAVDVDNGNIDPIELLELNKNIYSDLVNIADTAESVENSNGSKFWFEMDVIMPDEIQSTIIVKVRAVLGFGISNSICKVIDDWRAVIAGKCTIPNNIYLTSIVTAMLNDPDCSYSNVEKCSGFGATPYGDTYNYIPKGVDSKKEIRDHMPSAYFLFNSYNRLDCLTENYINTYYLSNNTPSITWWGDWQRPFIKNSTSLKKISSYRVGRVYVYGKYRHEFDVYYYENCVKVINPSPFTVKPTPSW